jgi:hypothetical protein
MPKNLFQFIRLPWGSSLPILMITLLLITSVLSACGGSGSIPSCNPDEMPAPQTVYPGPGTNVGYVFEGLPMQEAQPTFRWEYFGSCLPDSYRIIVSTVPIKDPEMYILDIRTPGAPGSDIINADRTTTHTLTWRPSSPLPPGIYYWTVIPYSGDFYGEWSSSLIPYGGRYSEPDRLDWTIFRVGETCGSFSRDYTLPPRLVYPRNGQTVHTISPLFFMWVDDNACILPGHYAIQFSDSPYGDFQPYSESLNIVLERFYSITNYRVNLAVPDMCTRVYWRVTPYYQTSGDLDIYILGALDYPGPISDVFFFDIDPALCVGAGTSTAESTPEVTLSAPPMALIRETSNCRSGPTANYPILDILVAGTQLPIQGRNPAGDAWLVNDSAIGKTCWVFGDLVEVSGDLSGVLIMEAQPQVFPTPTVPTDTLQVNCAQYNSNLCGSQPACKWEAGVCKNK